MRLENEKLLKLVVQRDCCLYAILAERFSVCQKRLAFRHMDQCATCEDFRDTI